jgi:methylase of polypeptide subunit release factors
MIRRCQVFTPVESVFELLDFVGYTNNLFNKKVIENACGDGNILKEIVKRYIEDALPNKTIDDIKIGLEQNIYGAEIDCNHYAKCINNLNKIAETYNIANVRWNIFNKDILKEKLSIKFDFVIGNPPYIAYKDLDKKTREFLKKTYKSCSFGKFDYCYAFIEHSLNSLTPRGRLAYLIPSNIFKNVFGQTLRDMICPYTTKVYDYTTQKLFKNALTSSAILICDKASNRKCIEYYDVVNNHKNIIRKDKLTDKWRFLNINNSVEKKRFGDYFSASITIATLYNKAYILKDYQEEEDYIIVGYHRIEKELVRKSVSPKTLSYGKEELILFPYRYKNGVLIRFSSETFEKEFPGAAEYLNSFSEKLHQRNSDKSINWFEYGRTQALAHLNQRKLLVSTIITEKTKVYLLSRNCIPYSGIYIIPKRGSALETAKTILESDAFYNYIQDIGISVSGNSKRITSVDINNFEF